VTNATKGRAIPKGEVRPPAKDKQALTATAKQLDTDIRRECALVQRSITKLAEMLAQMRERELWKYLRDPLHKGAYKRFEEYAQAALGPLSRTRVYSLLAIRELSQGPNPIPPETIERMGRVKANELARLSPEQRTPDVIQSAVEDTVPMVKQKVQEKLNMARPPEERKEALILLARNLPPQLIQMIEEIEADGVFMEGVCDGDMSVTLRAKLWHAVWTNFRANYEEELTEGRKRRLAMAAAKSAQAGPRRNRGAAAAHEVEDGSPP